MKHNMNGAQLRLWLDEPKSDDEGIFFNAVLMRGGCGTQQQVIQGPDRVDA